MESNLEKFKFEFIKTGREVLNDTPIQIGGM